ncbi:MAG: gamma carbonic anhydrase family protein [Acidobacteria bacterium]|jgi:carbonic anhydrase/acetyltransferase-like protein (isoleucine patch superfamily)|nr:gamma carbonic anhydrase family protein [Acidobacteriota bacterium]
MLTRSIDGRSPRFGRRVFVAANAVVLGDVTLEDDASVWYNVVLRGDIHWIRIGARSNLQDGVIVHVEHDLWPASVGEDVSVGHGAMLHGCTVGPRSLVGMGAIILNGAEIGEGSIVAAGAVVREGFKAPPGSLLAGVPAVVKREVSQNEQERIRLSVTSYLEYKSRYLAGGRDIAPAEVPDPESP